MLPYATYKAPFLCGLTVSCTQISPTERAAMKSIVVNNGGKFSDQLLRDKSTHLIAVEPRGDKYVYAMSWKTVHVVTIQWLQECVRKAGESNWVAMEFMHLPTHSSTDPSIHRDSDWVPEVDYYLESADKKKKKRPHTSQLLSNVELVDEAGSSLPQRRKHVHIIEEMDCFIVEHMSRLQLPIVRPADMEGGAATTLLNCNAFRGEVFWIDGFAPLATDVLIRYIVAGGGRRSMVLFDGVSKALLGPRPSSSSDERDSMVALLRRHPMGVECVNATWVVEQLFSMDAVVDMLRGEAPFSAFIESIDCEINSADDIMSAYTRFICVQEAQLSSLKESTEHTRQVTEDSASSEQNTKQAQATEVDDDDGGGEGRVLVDVSNRSTASEFVMPLLPSKPAAAMRAKRMLKVPPMRASKQHLSATKHAGSPGTSADRRSSNVDEESQLIVYRDTPGIFLR